MNLIISIVAFLMFADAIITWANFERFETLIKKRFPRINIKYFLMLEGGVGFLVLTVKILTNTVT